jgi:serine/threonine protein kinase/uncharacterized membrane protein
MADRTGQQLGNYRVIRPIGHGGFAEVYLGEHIYLKTQVAIKVLQTKVGNDEDLESFLKEAQTIAHLVHPQIVRVMDFGVDAETPFLVMDYAPNGTLRQRYPKGAVLPLTTIVSYVKQAAAGLQYAHDQKLVHRDIKPENILVGRNNEVLLSDFGIALIAQSSRYQSTQDVVGTVAYMSPEQIQGKPRPASDQYSLAVVVYEWLSGDRPFHGSFTELCTQHMFAAPPPLRERAPTIPPDVEHVVTTALAKDPKQRFMNIQAFANALEQASQSQLPTIPVPPPVPQYSSSFPPTQAVIKPISPKQNSIIPPFPPTQAAGMSIPQGARLPNYTNYPNQAMPLAGPPAPKVKVWSIGALQIVYMALGAALYGGLSLVTNIIQLPSAGNVSLRPAIVIPLFFGAVFGPWVGLFTGLVGNFIGDNISGYGVYWNWDLGIGLIGFVAGLAMLTTWGRYNNARNIIIAEVFAAVGIVVGIGFAAYSDIWISKMSFSAATVYELVPAAGSDLINGLVLLPILLIIYNAVTTRRTSV